MIQFIKKYFSFIDTDILDKLKININNTQNEIISLKKDIELFKKEILEDIEDNNKDEYEERLNNVENELHQIDIDNIEGRLEKLESINEQLGSILGS